MGIRPGRFERSCGVFVRRIYGLLRPGGFAAFITTNSIKDGDIRKDGLEQVLAQDGAINFAVVASSGRDGPTWCLTRRAAQR